MNIIKNAKGLLIALTLVTGSAQADLLSTDYVSDNFSYGNMFDINVLETVNTVTVTGFDLNLGSNSQTSSNPEDYTDGSGAGDQFWQIQIYAKVGTWDVNGDLSAGTDLASDPRNQVYWTLIDDVNVLSAGSGNATYIDVTDFSVASGINSLWITSTVATQQINYLGTDDNPTGTNVGDVISADDSLEILAGAGLRYDADNLSLFTTREFTGGIHYDVPAPTTLAIFGLALLGLAGARRKA